MPIPSDSETLSHLFTGELLLFGLASKVLVTEPAREWLQPLLDDDLFTEAPFADGQPDVHAGLQALAKWSSSLPSGLKEAALQELRRDYDRLFLGVEQSQAHPYESVYLSRDHLLFQEQTLQVRAWYRKYDLESEALHRVPDDHIGLELSFLAHLASLALLALEQNEMEAVDVLLLEQRAFLEQHLLRWAPTWCDQALQGAQTNFYRGMIQLIKGALVETAHVLDLQIPPAQEAAS